MIDSGAVVSLVIDTGLRSRSRKKSEVIGWSRNRISNNTGSRNRIVFPTPTPDNQLDYF